MDGLASCRMVLDRDDSDSFILDVDPMESAESDVPEKSRVFPLLPAGSEWTRALGWRTFSGVPYRLGDNLFLAFGLTEIVEHAERGAYPVSKFYLVPFEKDLIETCFERVMGTLDSIVDLDEEVPPLYGAILGDAEDFSEHRITEALILRRALAAYRREQLLLFRTAVISEEEIPSVSVLNLFGGRWNRGDAPLEFHRSLYCTVPSIYDDFSWTSKLTVMLEQ